MVAILVLVAVFLVVNGLVAGKFRDIAEMKGHDGESYFWYTFVFGIVGMLMVVALPNMRGVSVNNFPAQQPAATPAPEVRSTSEKDPNKNNAPVSAVIEGDEKICPKCGMKQKADRRICWSCGQHFDN